MATLYYFERQDRRFYPQTISRLNRSLWIFWPLTIGQLYRIIELVGIETDEGLIRHSLTL